MPNIRKCVEAGGCSREPWCWDESNFGYHDRFNAPDQPVVCVLWNNAQDTPPGWGDGCRQRRNGRRRRGAPMGASTRGGTERRIASKANYKGCAGATVAVGSYPAGASPYGALDMAGNAWEWTVDKYGEDYYGHSPARNPQGRADSGGFRVMREGRSSAIRGASVAPPATGAVRNTVPGGMGFG